jgi:diguanylate cyclase (GGDEF)-like protein
MGDTHRSWGTREASAPSLGRVRPGGSFIIDGDGAVLGFDGGMESLTGWPAHRVVAHGGSDEGPVVDVLESPPDIPADSSTGRIRMRCRDGSTLGADVAIRRLPGKGDRALISVLHILTRTRPDRAGQPDVDPLTQVSRGDTFAARIQNEIQVALDNASPLALILADVDHLRTINDTHGRDAGDRVLRELAGVLRVSVTDDTCLGRLGDDDFGILLPGGGRGEARQLAANLRSTVEQFRFSGIGDTRVTLSLGAASFPADADNSADLLDRAREALNEARAQGRNRVWCYLRRPRIPVQVPVYFDGLRHLLVGYSRDLSPSGVFVQTAAPVEIGMRCAFAFPLPGHQGNVHVIGRVVRSVPPDVSEGDNERLRIPGMGVEFERFGGPEDRRAIDAFIHGREETTLRPEQGRLSV